MVTAMATLDACNPLTVLVVEDTLDDGKLTLRALRRCERPLLARVATDVLHARRILGMGRALGAVERKIPDLIISDLKLSGLDGSDLARMVRAEPELARVPFLVFSSSNEPQDVERCFKSGADAYLQKPVDFNEYLECVSAAAHWALDGFKSPVPHARSFSRPRIASFHQEAA